MSLIGDLVLQTANAPGTATFNLIAAPAGRVSFMAGNGAGLAYYMATDGTSWEKGYGTVVAGSPDTLSRDLVLKNSSGTQPSKLNFTSPVTIISDIPAERALFASADNASVPFGSRVLSAVGAGVASSDASRMDQVAWLRIGSDVVVFGPTTQSFALDTSKYVKFRLEWVSAVPAASAPAFCRFSQNNEASYLSGASDYAELTATETTGGSTSVVASGSLSYGPLGAAGTGANSGVLNIDPTNGVMQANNVSLGPLTIFNSAFKAALTATPTHVQFGFASSTIAAARLRLTGWAI